MSLQYDLYLEEHKKNVAAAFNWLKQNLPEIVEMEKKPYPGYGKEVDLEHQVCYAHDSSRTAGDEYYPYDAYFYGGNKSHQVVQEFNMAWLKHIHRNPHHWQYWVLINDDPEEGEIVLPMPYNYIIEMICDWWSFSFAKGQPYEIFEWYDAHKDHMKLSEGTRFKVEGILAQIREKLDEMAESADVDELEHSGVKGMKWGVRRYQNKDGSLTEEGKERYSKGGRQRAKQMTLDEKFKNAEQDVRGRLTNSYSTFNKQDVDMVIVKDRGGLDDADATYCGSLAMKKFNEAAKLEPQITKDIVDSVSETSGKMYGLEYRLKQPTSIAGKIGSDAKDKQISFDDAYSGIKDAIRYTTVSENKDFVDNYNRVKESLSAKGYEETRCKNYFDLYEQGKVMHKAVQSTYRNADGYEFEMQFQTPSSQAAKELKIPIYEERRKVGIGEQRARELESEMRDLAEHVTNPPDIMTIKHK